MSQMFTMTSQGLAICHNGFKGDRTIPTKVTSLAVMSQMLPLASLWFIVMPHALPMISQWFQQWHIVCQWCHNSFWWCHNYGRRCQHNFWCCHKNGQWRHNDDKWRYIFRLNAKLICKRKKNNFLNAPRHSAQWHWA